MSRGRPPRWDVARGREMWDAGVPLVDIAAFADMRPRHMARYIRDHKWPARGLKARLYPCIACGVDRTATRRDSRCPACSYAHKLERHRRLRRRAKEAPPRESGRPTLELVGTYVCLPTRDLLEQDRVMSRARRAAAAKVALEDARRIMELYDVASKPKRGRPKQSIGRAANARERAA